jgi:hypothetical protein
MVQLWFELTSIVLFVIMIFVGSVSVPVYVLTARGRWIWAMVYCLITVAWTWALHHFASPSLGPAMQTAAELWWNQYWWGTSLGFYIVIGVTLGLIVWRQGSATTAFLLPVLVGSLVILAAIGILLQIAPAHLGQTVSAFVNHELQQMVDQALAMAKDAPPEQVALIRDMGGQMIATSLRLLPATVWLMGLAVTALTLLIGKRFLPRQLWMKYQGGLTRWKAPAVCVWVVILLGALYFASAYGLHLQHALAVVYNGLLAVAGVFLLQGAMIVTYYIRRQRDGIFRWMWYGMIVLFIKTAMIVMILLGVFDYWVDFRRIERKIVL